jgi:hypothetical protein
MVACLPPFRSNFLTYFVKIWTFCGLQKFLHKSTQNQQMLKNFSNSKSLTTIDVSLSPNINYNIKNDKSVRSQKKCEKCDYIQRGNRGSQAVRADSADFAAEVNFTVPKLTKLFVVKFI